MRPKLILNQLYYMKMKNVYTPTAELSSGSRYGTFENHEYLVKVIRLDRLPVSEHYPFGCLRAGLQILAGTQYPEDGSEMWRPGDDADFGWVRYVSVDQKFQKDRLVIMKLNHKRLPLYTNWPYGKEIITHLLQEAA